MQEQIYDGRLQAADDDLLGTILTLNKAVPRYLPGGNFALILQPLSLQTEMGCGHLLVAQQCLQGYCADTCLHLLLNPCALAPTLSCLQLHCRIQPAAA